MPNHVVAASGRQLAAQLAGAQCGTVSRRQLYAAGVPRWLVRLELRARRWPRAGRHTVVVLDGPLDAAARRWVAVLEAGPRAALDGVGALQAAGLELLIDEGLFRSRGWHPRA